MFFSTCSAGGLSGPDFCFIFAPCGYDEPEILPSGSPSIGLTGADGGHARICKSSYLGRHTAPALIRAFCWLTSRSESRRVSATMANRAAWVALAAYLRRARQA